MGAPAVEHLITTYPAWVKVEDLPVEELEDRMKVAGDLWEKGILLTSEPLESHYDDPGKGGDNSDLLSEYSCRNQILISVFNNLAHIADEKKEKKKKKKKELWVDTTV